jgi:PhoH-like ATPase
LKNGFKETFVIDTNIVLEDSSNILKLSSGGESLIAIPETVLDEIDSKKSGFSEINYQAREFARLLEDSQFLESFEVDGGYKIVQVLLPRGVRIDIISKSKYELQRGLHQNIESDRKILEIAKFAQNYYENTTFISLDIMARVRALSLDIRSRTLQLEKDSDSEIEFEKSIEVSFEDLQKLQDREIEELDRDYKPQNFCYNWIQQFSNYMVLSVVKNGKVELLDEEELRDQIITPLNREQLYLSHSIIDPFFQVVVVEASAGSGKTLLALSGAIKLIRRGDFKKIIYIRNSVESLDKGEDVGYLPGLEEKFRIYNHPLMDSLDYIVRSEYRRKHSSRKGDNFRELGEDDVKQRVEEAILRYGIETMWVGEMRGRTISNATVIVDEAQNISNKTMQMVLSRIDSSCKVIVLGSNKQIDNFYINRYTNSLTTLLKATRTDYEGVNMFAIRLSKVLRGPITEWAESLFSRL